MTSENFEGIALMLCDSIITEAGTNKKTLIGTFNQIAAPAVPATHPKMSAFVCISEGRGEYDVSLRICKTPDDSNVTPPPMFEIRGRVKFSTPLAVIEIAFNLEGVTFAEYGRYDIEFLCNGVPVLTRPFFVVAPPQPSLPPPTT